MVEIGKERMEVRKYFSEEELEDRRKTLEDSSLKRRALRIRQKLYSTMIRERVKIHDEEIELTLQELRDKFKLVTTVCTTYADYEEGRIRIITPDGEVVHERPMMPSERQQIIPFPNTGTMN